jgi:Zn-dependent metalloprotease
MNKINYTYLIVFCTCLLLFTVVKGQLANKGLITAASNGIPIFIEFDEKHPVGSNDAEQVLLTNLANNNPLVSFSKTQEIIDKIGCKHEKYQQYYQGIKVEFAVYSVHYSSENEIIALSGEFAPIDILSIIPMVNEEEALTTVETFLDSTSTEFSVLEGIIISKNFNITENTYHLAYKFNINGQIVHVDAINDEVIATFSSAFDAANDACTRYSGTVQITTEFDGTNYILEDNTRGDGIIVYNNQDLGFSSNALTGELLNIINFEDLDNDWCGGIWSNSNSDQDNAALDIFWNLQKIYDYFLQVHNRNSFDNQGGKIRALTHIWFNNTQKFAQYIPANSFGSLNQPVMLFGDGMAWNDPNPDEPWASLDIVAHEFAHGVAISTFGISPPNNPTPNTNEIGAISESLSDIWAVIIENWVVSNGLNDAPNDLDKDKWLLGEEFRTNLSTEPKGIRSMKSPKDPPFFHSDTYLHPAATWNNQIPHARGGVMNYWFYLLSEGGSGINDNGVSYNIQPIGIEQAADIIYLATIAYFTALVDFKGARQATLQAQKIYMADVL